MKKLIPLGLLWASLAFAGDPAPAEFEYFDLGFSDGEGYHTEIRTFNPSFTETVNLQLRAGYTAEIPAHRVFHNHSSVYTVTLPPLASARVVTNGDLPWVQHASMQLTSDGPVVAWNQIQFGDNVVDHEKTDSQAFRTIDTVPDVMRFNDLAGRAPVPRFPTRGPSYDLPLTELLVVRNSEAFTRTVDIVGRDALLGNELEPVQLTVPPRSAVSASAGDLFGNLGSGRAAVEVHNTDGRVYAYIRREDPKTLMRALPAADASQTLAFAHLTGEGYEGYATLAPRLPLTTEVTGNVFLGAPAEVLPFTLAIDQPGITRFMASSQITERPMALGTMRFEASTDVTGEFTLFGDGARTQIRLTPFAGRRAVFHVGREFRRGGERDLLLIENPSNEDDRLTLLGINREGGLRDVIPLELSPGSHVFETQDLFGEETELVLLEKFSRNSTLHVAYLLTEDRGGVYVLDSIDVVEVAGHGTISRFLEQVSTWETTEVPCFQEPVHLLGLVDMVNRSFECGQGD